MVDQLTLQTIGILLTGLTVSIAAIYYTLTLKYTRRNQDLQLETRQAQIFTQLMDKYTTKEGLKNLRVIRRANWSSYEEWLEIFRNDDEYNNAYNWLSHIYAGVGALLRDGLLNVRMVALVSASGIFAHWENYKDVIYERRKRTNNRTYRSEWEYLFNTIMKYLEEHPELAP